MSKTEKICAVVVTYNRKELLLDCLNALRGQTTLLDAIYIIDNFSNDGTPQVLLDNKYINILPPEELKEPWETTSQISDNLSNIIIHYLRIDKNTGGAGGFYEGIKRAYEKGYDWVWLMDDDAKPDRYALEALIDKYKEDRQRNKCFVSIATDEEKNLLSWGIGIILDGKTHIFEYLKDVPSDKELKAPWASFLGLLIPKEIIKDVGLPKKEYFIWGDDVEYSFRIWNAGYEIYYVKNSLIYHPIQEKIKIKFLGKEIMLINAEDWKQYYGIRNDVYTLSRQRKFLTMLKKIMIYFLVWKVRGMKLKTLHFYVRGLFHGLIGRLGRY